MRSILLAASTVFLVAATWAMASGQDPAVFPAELHYSNAQKPEVKKQLAELIGKPAPKLVVGPWHEQKDESGKVTDAAKSLEELKGSIVVIDFWGTWCPPCRRAIPHTSKVAQHYADKGVEVIAVSNTRGSETMAQLADELGMSFPTAADLDDQTKNAYKVQWWPFYVLIDREGIVRAAGLRPDKIDEAIDILLAEQPYKPEA